MELPFADTANGLYDDRVFDDLAAAAQHATAIKGLFLDKMTATQRKALRQACTALMPALPGAPKRLLPPET